MTQSPEDIRRANMIRARAARRKKLKMASGKFRRKAQAVEPIIPTTLYAMMLVPELVGLSHRSLDHAVETGMTTYRVGGREFVLGSDLIAFVTRPEYRRQRGVTEN